MSEQDDSKKRSAKAVRRVTKKDRKRKIETGSLFPPDDDLRFAPPEPVPQSAPDSAPEDAAADTTSSDEAEDAPPLAPDEYPLEALIDEEEEQPTTTVAIADDAERFPPINPAAIQRPSVVKAQTAAAQSQRHSHFLHNVLTIFFLLGTIGIIALFAVIWLNPFSSINPLPPDTPTPIVITQTPLPTDTPSPTPTETFTPLPVLALTEFVPSATFTPAPFPFTLADNGVIYAPNGNGQGCNWSSIAGSVTDLDGRPLNGFGIHIIGEDIDEIVTSGTIASFGPGSYELFLNGVPQRKPYTLQLLSPQGAPLSDELTVVTSELCSQNVTIVNFVQNHAF